MRHFFFMSRDHSAVPSGAYAVDPAALEAARRGVPRGEYH